MAPLSPILIGNVNTVVVGAGYALLGRKCAETLLGRCDSFIGKRGCAFPTYRREGVRGYISTVPGRLLHDVLSGSVCSKELGLDPCGPVVSRRVGRQRRSRR